MLAQAPRDMTGNVQLNSTAAVSSVRPTADGGPVGDFGKVVKLRGDGRSRDPAASAMPHAKWKVVNITVSARPSAASIKPAMRRI